jgi:hypothetical protein
MKCNHHVPSWRYCFLGNIFLGGVNEADWQLQDITFTAGSPNLHTGHARSYIVEHTYTGARQMLVAALPHA